MWSVGVGRGVPRLPDLSLLPILLILNAAWRVACGATGRLAVGGRKGGDGRKRARKLIFALRKAEAPHRLIRTNLERNALYVRGGALCALN